MKYKFENLVKMKFADAEEYKDDRLVYEERVSDLNDEIKARHERIVDGYPRLRYTNRYEDCLYTFALRCKASEVEQMVEDFMDAYEEWLLGQTHKSSGVVIRQIPKLEGYNSKKGSFGYEDFIIYCRLGRNHNGQL